MRSATKPRTELNVRARSMRVSANQGALIFTMNRVESDAARREGAYSEVWFFNARATGRARVCMQSTVGFSEAAALRPRAWRHRREICIYQAGATNISFIICSERLICSPRRAASTCPPPLHPPAATHSPAADVVLFPSLSASSRVTRHSIPRASVD